jgi:ankyrin repeat protein
MYKLFRYCVEVFKSDQSVLDNEAIRLSSINGHHQIVKDLLQIPEVDPTALDNQALVKSSENGHIEVVKLLVEDARFDSRALHNAIRGAYMQGHFEVVEYLLDNNFYARTM